MNQNKWHADAVHKPSAQTERWCGSLWLATYTITPLRSYASHLDR